MRIYVDEHMGVEVIFLTSYPSKARSVDHFVQPVVSGCQSREIISIIPCSNESEINIFLVNDRQ